MVDELDGMYGGLGFTPASENEKGNEGDKGTPAGGEAGSEKPAEKPAATQMPGTKEFFGETFEIEDWDTVKTKIPEFISQAKEYQSKKEEIEQLRSLNANPFANETIAGFNEFVKKTGIDNFQTYQSIKGIDIANSDPIEIMVADQIIANPSLVGKEAVLRSKLIKEHGLDDTLNTQDEIEVNKALLRSKIEPIREKLKGLVDFKYTPVTPQSFEEGVSKRYEQYKPQVISAVSDLAAIPVEAEAQDGTKIKVLDYAVPAEYIAKAADDVAKLIARNGLTVSEKTLPDIKASIVNKAILENFGKIIHAAIKQREQEISEQYDIQLDNPSAFGSQKSNPTGGRKVSFENQLFSE